MSKLYNLFNMNKRFVTLLQGMDVEAFEKKFNTLEVDFIHSQQLFCGDVLKLRPGQQAVISNGRVSGFSFNSAIL